MEDRILTVPNLFTLVRLLCLPIFVLLLNPHPFAAAVLLAILGSTDWIDGQLARRLNQVSTFGKVFDPTVDRLLLVTAAVALLVNGTIPLFIGTLALLRELVIAFFAAVLYSRGATRIDVQFIGKAGAFCLMVSLPLFLASHSTVSIHSTFRILAYVFGIAGLVFAYASLYAYEHLAKEALAKGRARLHRK